MITFENSICKCELVRDKINIISNFCYVLNRNGQLIQYDIKDKYSETNLSILDKRFHLNRTYIFKKEFDYIDDIRIPESNENYIIISFERIFHIIFLNDFKIYTFPGNEIHHYGDYLLFLNEEGYSECTSLSFINIKTRKREILNWFTDYFSKLQGYVGFGFRIINGILEYEGMKQKYFYDLTNDDKFFIDPKLSENNKLNLFNCDGYFIDYHSIGSTLNEDGSFTTIRTEIGELLFRYKYNFDVTVENKLSDLISTFIIKVFPFCDVIIPVPPSNLKRPFQPLFELTQSVSEKTRIPCNLNYLKKKETPQLKGIDDINERREILKNAFYVPNKRYNSKSILLIDDLFRSGESINAALKVLKEQGAILNIYVLVITKTRTKK